jgi:hypothetical protein
MRGKMLKNKKSPGRGDTNLKTRLEPILRYIGVGMFPPLPPNRTGGSPAYGSPVTGFHIGTDVGYRSMRLSVRIDPLP